MEIVDFQPLVFYGLVSVAISPHHHTSPLYPYFKAQLIFTQFLYIFSFPDFELEVESLLRIMGIISP